MADSSSRSPNIAYSEADIEKFAEMLLCGSELEDEVSKELHSFTVKYQLHGIFGNYHTEAYHDDNDGPTATEIKRDLETVARTAKRLHAALKTKPMRRYLLRPELILIDTVQAVRLRPAVLVFALV
jgi:hypothetical protein